MAGTRWWNVEPLLTAGGLRRGGRRDDDHPGRPVVLVVDDHADSRELVATVLQDIGVAIAEAAPARDALVRAWSKPHPHLVLIDLSLPDCHGTDVVAHAQAGSRARATFPSWR